MSQTNYATPGASVFSLMYPYRPASNVPIIVPFPDRIEPLYTLHTTSNSLVDLISWNKQSFLSTIMTYQVSFWLDFDMHVTILRSITKKKWYTYIWSLDYHIPPGIWWIESKILFETKLHILESLIPYSYLISKGPLYSSKIENIMYMHKMVLEIPTAVSRAHCFEMWRLGNMVCVCVCARACVYGCVCF